MAISAPHYYLMKSLKPILPIGGKLLEIGEANWYGDENPHRIIDLIDGADWEQSDIYQELKAAIAKHDHFAIARAFYQAICAPSIIHAIDLNGTPSALRQDLNRPLHLANSYDVVINNGTAEHIFNIGQVFRSIHDACKVGGLMIHESPMTGWIDHGFYCLQPTLFYDLAAANGYEVVQVSIHEIRSQTIQPVESRECVCKLAEEGKIPMNAMLFVVYRKQEAGDFKLPMQGYYDGSLSQEGREAWETKR